MPVETVIGQIHLPADKPLRPWALPVEDFVPLFEPVQLGGNAAPEFFRLLNRFAIDALVLFLAFDVRGPAEFLRRFEFALFLQNGIDIGAGSG